MSRNSVKNFRVWSIGKLVSSFPAVSFTRGSCGELGTSGPREPVDLFIQSVPLSLVFYCSSSVLAQGNPFSNVPPPFSKHVAPSPMGAYLSSSYLPSENPMPLPKKWCFILHFLFSVVVPC